MSWVARSDPGAATKGTGAAVGESKSRQTVDEERDGGDVMPHPLGRPSGPLRRAALLMGPLVLWLLLAACDAGSSHPGGGQPVAPLGHSRHAIPGPGLTPSRIPAPPSAASSSPEAPPAAPGCLEKSTSLAPRPTGTTLCARADLEITVLLQPSGIGAWSAPTSSDSAVAEITAHHQDPGGLHIQLHTTAAGRTVIATSTQPADPHGPPTQTWRLTLTVDP